MQVNLNPLRSIFQNIPWPTNMAAQTAPPIAHTVCHSHHNSNHTNLLLITTNTIHWTHRHTETLTAK